MAKKLLVGGLIVLMGGCAGRPPIPEAVQSSFLAADRYAFSIRACDKVETEAHAALSSFHNTKLLLEQRYGQSHFSALNARSNNQFLTVQIEHCAGQGGAERLQTAVKKLQSLTNVL